jgi:hypothetical protein
MKPIVHEEPPVIAAIGAPHLIRSMRCNPGWLGTSLRMRGYADLPPIIFQGTGLARLNTIRRLGVALDGIDFINESIEVVSRQVA